MSAFPTRQTKLTQKSHGDSLPRIESVIGFVRSTQWKCTFRAPIKHMYIALKEVTQCDRIEDANERFL